MHVPERSNDSLCIALAKAYLGPVIAHAFLVTVMAGMRQERKSAGVANELYLSDNPWISKARVSFKFTFPTLFSLLLRRCSTLSFSLC